MPADDQQPLAQAIGIACYGEEPRCERLNRGGNAVFRMSFGDGSRVLKLAAGTSDPAIGKEAALFRLLAATDIPVPAIEHADPRGERFGRPYLITADAGAETVDDRCASDPESSVGWADRMGKVLAEVHRLDLSANSEFAAALERADTQAFWPNVCEVAKAFARAGVFDPSDVERLVSQDAPNAAGEALSHADFSAKQCVASGDRIAAVVDWAAAWIGDPAIDVAIAAAHWDIARRPGGAQELINGYRRVASLPAQFESVDRVARMAFVVHVVGLWHGQIALSSRAGESSGKLAHARALFAEYARGLD